VSGVADEVAALDEITCGATRDRNGWRVAWPGCG